MKKKYDKPQIGYDIRQAGLPTVLAIAAASAAAGAASVAVGRMIGGITPTTESLLGSFEKDRLIIANGATI